MAQALYRKYRPHYFRDVTGQENITTVLSREVAEGTFSHAYLFTGSRGIGKTTCAKILAKAVNCPNEKDGEPCGICPICQGIDDGSLLDVTEMDAASNRNIDDIRNLRSEANFTPAVAKYRVYIIDEAHMLTKEAANALLKILEEPPEHVIFILATTEVNRLPNTILSRCMRFDFKRMSPEVIAERLKFVCRQEKIAIDDDAAYLIGKLADGGMRDAMSMLDICRSSDEKITAETVSRCAGMAGHEYLYELCDMISAQDSAGVLACVDRLYKDSADVTRICDELINHYRNLMVTLCTKDAERILNVLPGDLKRLSDQANALSLERIFYGISVLQDTLGKMSSSASKRLEFEMALVKLCIPAMSSSQEAVLARLDSIEREIKILKSGVPTAAAVPARMPETAPKAETAAPKPESRKEEPAAVVATEKVPAVQSGLFIQWDEVVDALRTKSPMIYPFLSGSRAYFIGGRVLIDAENPMLYEFMRNNSSAIDDVKNAIAEVTGTRYGIGPYRGTERPASPADPMKEFADRAKQMDIPVTITGVTEGVQ